MILVGIVGMTGAGKTELSYLFEKKGYTRIRFGDITEERIRDRGKDVTVETERIERESIRKEHGMHAYAKLNLPKIRQAMEKGNVVIDGLYSWEEYTFLKEIYEDQIYVVAVFAPPEVRYERLVDRDSRPLTREQALDRDYKEVEKLNKGGPIAMADYVITNVGTLYDLEQSFEKFLDWLREHETELG